jgi:hypothetical protein
MKWRPVLLMPGGFNPDQASGLTAAIEAIRISTFALPVSSLRLSPPFRRPVKP